MSSTLSLLESSVGEASVLRSISVSKLRLPPLLTPLQSRQVSERLRDKGQVCYSKSAITSGSFGVQGFASNSTTGSGLKLLSVFFTMDELARSNCTKAERRELLNQEILQTIKCKMSLDMYTRVETCTKLAIVSLFRSN